jgi:hypothetical protein
VPPHVEQLRRPTYPVGQSQTESTGASRSDPPRSNVTETERLAAHAASTPTSTSRIQWFKVRLEATLGDAALGGEQGLLEVEDYETTDGLQRRLERANPLELTTATGETDE